jgi:hypothetical protein
MNFFKFSFSLIAFASVCNLSAGTIFFKDGSKLSDVEIISISEGEIIVEKDKAQKSYDLKLLKAYYNTDIDTGGDTDPKKYVDYKVNIITMKVPERGQKTVSGKKKTESVEIEYTLSKKGKEGDKIKAPYFYLHILTTGKDEYDERKVYSYSYPKQAKAKGKSYDVAAILAEVLDFGRPVWDIDKARIKTSLSGKKFKIDLKSIGTRKILAWHIEVWGNEDRILEKDRVVDPRAGIGKTWWKRKR